MLVFLHYCLMLIMILTKKGIEGLTKLKPAPLFSSKNTTLITPCTYDNDLEKLKDCDLIIEAVAEKN